MDFDFSRFVRLPLDEAYVRYLIEEEMPDRALVFRRLWGYYRNELDGLAGGGIRFTQFSSTPRCSPSRASLMTGLHPHQVGIGILTGYDGPDPEAEDVITALTDNPIWNAHPAVAEGRVRSFPAGIWTFGGPRSSQQVIAAYLDALSG